MTLHNLSKGATNLKTIVNTVYDSEASIIFGGQIHEYMYLWNNWFD